MFFCRMHGEPLVRNEQACRWECPEYPICGTYVNDEAIFRGMTLEDLEYFQRFSLTTERMFGMQFSHGYLDVL